MARSPILDATAEVAPYVAGENPYLLRSESSTTGRLILNIGTPDFDSYLKVTTLGGIVLESPAQMLLDINAQPLDAELSALAGLTSVANRVPYFTGSGTAALATFTAAGRTLVGLSNSASLVTLAGLTPSTTGLNLIVLGTPDFDSYLKITTAGGTVMESPTQVILDGGGAFATNPLSQFAATTSAELRGVISDETGTGSLVFATAPTFADTITLNSTSVSPSYLLSISGSTKGRLMTAHANASGSDFATIGDVILRSETGNDLIVQARGTGTLYFSTGNPDVARMSLTSTGLVSFLGLTTNGFLKTSGSTGAVSVDTASYEPALGNPGTSGHVLASTTGGTRSWVAKGDFSTNTGSAIDGELVLFSGTTGKLGKRGILPSSTGLLLLALGTPDFDSYLKITNAGAAIMESPAQVLIDINGEPSLGNPGTDGFVLSSTAAGVRSWVAPAAASVATDAIWDAKGDLAVGTGANTAARLAIGANDTIAVADSTQTTGIRWGTPESIRTALGLVIGTNVQAFDADLTTWAGLTPSANAQSLVTATDYAAMRTLLGLAIGTNVQAFDADLTTWAGLTPSANAQSLVTAADYSAMRTLLGLVIGTNIQAWDADLDAWATKTPYAGVLTITTGKTFNVTNTLTLSGTDGSTLSIGAGGTLGSNAFNSTAFEPALGNPATNGFVLSSTTGGTRSWVAASGGDALTTNPLSQFAATTSAQLAGVMSDETGSGALVFANSPTFVTPNLGEANVTAINFEGFTGSMSYAGGVGPTFSDETTTNTLAFNVQSLTDTRFIVWPNASGTVLLSGNIGSTIQAWDAQLDSLAALSYGTNALKVVRVNAAETGFEVATVSGGAVAQTVVTKFTTYASTTAAIPVDDTIPQNTEGTELFTGTITPTSATNVLDVEVVIPIVAHSGTANVTAALFRDSTADAVDADIVGHNAASAAYPLILRYSVVAGSTSATTFKVRYGTGSGTAYINGNTTNRLFGGVAGATMKITERAP